MTIPKQFSFVTKRPYWWVYVLGILVLIITLWCWWAKIYMGPERVFWGMLERSLTTRGVTVELAQDSGQGSIRQLVQMELGATNRAHSLSTLTQGGTKIKTEVIGTRDTDYTRYRSIQTDQTNAEGKPLNVAKVVNVWSKSDSTPQSATQARGNQLFSQAVLGIGLPIGTVPVPIGEISPEARNELLHYMRDRGVYRVSFKSKDVKKEKRDGRTVYVYKAKIQTILYVQMMKHFAKELGLHELDQVDPNSYQDSPTLEVTLTVDPYSRQLVAVDNGQEGFTQTYQGYGLPLKATLPKKPISSAELQQRLTEL